MFTYGQEVIERESGQRVTITQRHTRSNQYEVSDGHGNRRWLDASALRHPADAPAEQPATLEAALATVKEKHAIWLGTRSRSDFRAVMRAHHAAQLLGATSKMIHDAERH